MAADDLLKGLDPNCQALNDICGRVENEVRASGLRGKQALAAERERLRPLLAGQRASCETCRVYRPAALDFRWAIFAGAALGLVVGFVLDAPKSGRLLGTAAGAAVTVLALRRRR
jgi:hypothetical protein